MVHRCCVIGIKSLKLMLKPQKETFNGSQMVCQMMELNCLFGADAYS
jgi:hypothetical protein